MFMLYLSINVTVLIELSIVEIYLWGGLSGFTAWTKHFYIYTCFLAQLKALIAEAIFKKDALYFVWKLHSLI